MAKRTPKAGVTETTEQAAADDAIAVTGSNMLGDLMGLVMDELKALPDVWHRIGETTQEETIERVKKRVQSAVDSSVDIICSKNRPTVVGKVDSVTFKDGIKAVLVIRSSEPMRHELAEATGSEVLIVIAHGEEFSGGADLHKADPDQPDILAGLESVGSSPAAQPRTSNKPATIDVKPEAMIDNPDATAGAPPLPAMRNFLILPKTGSLAAKDTPQSVVATDAGQAWASFCEAFPHHYARANFYVEEITPDQYETSAKLWIDDAGKWRGGDAQE